MIVIFIRGCPGAGKSTVAEKVCELLDGVHIQVDTYKRTFRKRYPELDFGACCVYAYKMTRFELSKRLQDTEYVVIDEILSDSEFNRILIDFCQKHHVPTFWFTLSRSMEDLLKVEESRNREIKNTIEDFEIFKKAFEDTRQEGEIVVENSDIEKTVERILAVIHSQ